MTRTASSTNITTTGAGLQSGGPPLGSAEEEMEKVRAVGDLLVNPNVARCDHRYPVKPKGRCN